MGNIIKKVQLIFGILQFSLCRSLSLFLVLPHQFPLVDHWALYTLPSPNCSSPSFVTLLIYSFSNISWTIFLKGNSSNNFCVCCNESFLKTQFRHILLTSLLPPTFTFHSSYRTYFSPLYLLFPLPGMPFCLLAVFQLCHLSAQHTAHWMDGWWIKYSTILNGPPYQNGPVILSLRRVPGSIQLCCETESQKRTHMRMLKAERSLMCDVWKYNSRI